MNGFLNINKPPNISSFDVIRKLRKALPSTKMGHLGTLDPLATGVLPIAVGWATRLIDYVSDTTKEYRAEMILGGISDTQDSTGQITTHSYSPVDVRLIEEAFNRFTGELEQVPPSYSAVHHEGQRLYHLARQGIHVEVAPRRIIIYQLRMVDISADQGIQKVLFNVECSSGTYIRTLCHDIGSFLGTGAYMNNLVRTRSGPFSIEKSCDLEILISDSEYLLNHLLPVDYPLGGADRINISEEDSRAINNGMTIKNSYKSPVHNLVVLYDNNDKLLALAKYVEIDEQAYIKPIRVVPQNASRKE